MAPKWLRTGMLWSGHFGVRVRRSGAEEESAREPGSTVEGVVSPPEQFAERKRFSSTNKDNKGKKNEDEGGEFVYGFGPKPAENVEAASGDKKKLGKMPPKGYMVAGYEDWWESLFEALWKSSAVFPAELVNDAAVFEQAALAGLQVFFVV